MPPAEVELADLPGTLTEAATGAISISTYQQPAVTVKPKKSKLSPEERQQLAERLRQARKQAVLSKMAQP
jgi:hypothetical protein